MWRCLAPMLAGRVPIRTSHTLVGKNHLISPVAVQPRNNVEVHAHEMHAYEIHAYEMQMTPIRYTPMRHMPVRCTPMP
jgi:hypothetical protein